VVQAVRYLGSTLGVALVVAFTTGLAGDDALDGFHRVWGLLVGCGLAVSLLSTRLARQPAAAPVSVEAAAEVAAGVAG
jgi:hypothetical protein